VIPRLRNILINTLLVLVSTLATLALIEIGLRYSRFAQLPEHSYGYPPYYFETDTELGYDISKFSKGKIHNHSEHPYKVFSNEYGCFDESRDVPDKYALIVGDSLTWGYAPLNEKWTTKLEEMTKYFMLKCGVTGYGTLQELNKAKRVVKDVGKPPTHIIVLYIGNDLNDDYLFPQRTVYQGHLASYIENLDMKTGKIYRRSQQDIERIYARYKENTISNRLLKWQYSLVTFRLWRTQRGRIKRFIRGLINHDNKVASATDKPKNPDRKKPKDNDSKKPTAEINHKDIVNKHRTTAKRALSILPPGMTGASVYKVTLSRYLDTTDRTWFNKAVEQHQKNLYNFINYADSIGAKLLLVDATATLTHPRYRSLISRFNDSSRHSYYNLSSDYKKFITWKNDAHWNIEGNHQAAQYIFGHIEESGFLR